MYAALSGGTAYICDVTIVVHKLSQNFTHENEFSLYFNPYVKAKIMVHAFVMKLD